MTHREFINIQDNILELKGRELAVKLGVPASSISNWRKPPEEDGRPVPDYIAILLGHLQALHFGTVQIALTIDEIMELSTLATQRRLGFGEYILTLIREQLHTSTGTNTVPDSDSDPSTGQFHPPLSPEEYRRSLPTGQPDSQQHLNEDTQNQP